MKIKKINELLSEIDPYNEEDWGEKNKYFLLLNNKGKIIFVSQKVPDEKEAMRQFTFITGCTNEYGKLTFKETTKDEIRNLLREKRTRESILSDEVDTLRNEIHELNRCR